MTEIVTLSELKAWARVDSDDDDALLEALGSAAAEFVAQATGRVFDFDDDVPERARVAVKALAAHWYENRESMSVQQAYVVPMHVRALIHQLRDWTEPEAMTGEGEGDA
jgi:uncharacterized phage protein (predicted DNA packaging)